MAQAIYHKVGTPPVVINNDGTSAALPGPSLSLASGTVGDNAFLGLLVDGTNPNAVCPSGSSYTITTADIGSGLWVMNTGFKGTFTIGKYNIFGVTVGVNTVQRWILDRSPAAVGSSGANWNIGPVSVPLPYASGITRVDQSSLVPNPGMVFALGGGVYGRNQSVEG